MARNIRGGTLQTLTNVTVVNLIDIDATDVTTTNLNGTNGNPVNAPDGISTTELSLTALTPLSIINTNDYNILIHDPVTGRLYKFNSLYFSPFNNRLYVPRLTVNNGLTINEDAEINSNHDFYFREITPTSPGDKGVIFWENIARIIGKRTSAGLPELQLVNNTARQNGIDYQVSLQETSTQLNTTGNMAFRVNNAVKMEITNSNIIFSNIDLIARDITANDVTVNGTLTAANISFTSANIPGGLTVGGLTDLNGNLEVFGTVKLTQLSAAPTSVGASVNVLLWDGSTGLVSGDSTLKYYAGTDTLETTHIVLSSATINNLNVMTEIIQFNRVNDTTSTGYFNIQFIDSSNKLRENNALTFNPSSETLRINNLYAGEITLTAKTATSLDNNNSRIMFIEGNGVVTGKISNFPSLYFNPSSGTLLSPILRSTTAVTTPQINILGTTNAELTVDNTHGLFIDHSLGHVLKIGPTWKFRVANNDTTIYNNLICDAKATINGDIYVTNSNISTADREQNVVFHDINTNGDTRYKEDGAFTYNPNKNILTSIYFNGDINRINNNIVFRRDNVIKAYIDTGAFTSHLPLNLYDNVGATNSRINFYISNPGVDLVSSIRATLNSGGDKLIQFSPQPNNSAGYYMQYNCINGEMDLAAGRSSDTDPAIKLRIFSTTKVKVTQTETEIKNILKLNDVSVPTSSTDFYLLLQNTGNNQVKRSNAIYNPVSGNLKLDRLTIGNGTFDDLQTGLQYDHTVAHNIKVNGASAIFCNSTDVISYKPLSLYQEDGITLYETSAAFSGTKNEIVFNNLGRIISSRETTSLRPRIDIVNETESNFVDYQLRCGVEETLINCGNQNSTGEVKIQVDSVDKVRVQDGVTIMTTDLTTFDVTSNNIATGNPIRYGNHLLFTPLNFVFVIGNTNSIFTIDPSNTFNNGRYGQGTYLSILRSGVKTKAYGADISPLTWNAYIQATGTPTSWTFLPYPSGGLWKIKVTYDYEHDVNNTNRVNPICKFEKNGVVIEEGYQSIYIRMQLGRVGTVVSEHVFIINSNDVIKLRTYINFGGTQNFSSIVNASTFNLSNFCMTCQYLGPLPEYDRTPP